VTCATRLRRHGLSLSYASINWIRFEGSSCRAVRSMTSQPPGGAPLAVCKVTLWIGGVNRCRGLAPRAGIASSGTPTASSGTPTASSGTPTEIAELIRLFVGVLASASAR
jgi:hypothetical protein